MRATACLKRRFLVPGIFSYPQAAIALSYFVLPFLFFFGFEFSGIYKKVFSPGDNLFYNFPVKMFSKNVPLWNDLICTGNPAIADPQLQSFYPISLLLMNLLPAPLSFNSFVLIHYTLAGFFTYLFLRELKLSRFSSYWGSVVFMFCGFCMGHKQHINMIDAGIWLPLVLFSLERAQNTLMSRYFLLGTFAVAMSVLAGYPQITMLLGFVTLAYGLWNAISARTQERKWCMALSAILMLLFGGLLSAMQLFPTLEALGMSTRESIKWRFFTTYSFGYQYLPMLIYPYFLGGGYSGSNLNFRSTNVTVAELAGYVGILPLLMAFLAFLVYRKASKQVWFWTLTAAVSFVLVLGDSTPLYTWIYRIPIINLFRGPARNWFECDFALAVLSSLGMESFIENRPGLSKNVRKWTSVLVGGCLLTLGFSVFAFRTIQGLPPGHAFFLLTKIDSVQLLARNLELTSPAVYVPMLLLGLSICFLLVIPRTRKTNTLLLALILFLVVDLFSFGYYHDRFFIPYSGIIQGTPPISFIKSQPDQDSFRVFCTRDMVFRTLLSPNTSMLYGIRTISGFEDVLLKDYFLVTGFSYLGVAKPEREKSLIVDNDLLSLMAARFIVTQDKELVSLLRTTRRSGHLLYTPVYKGKLASVESEDIRNQIPLHLYLRRTKVSLDAVEIFRNENFLPRARFAGTVIPVRNLNEAIDFIAKSQSFDFRKCVVAETGEDSTQHLAGGVILDARYNPRRIQLTVRTDGRSFLVLSDQFYRGWQASVDGIETAVYRTNGIMKGIYVDKPGVSTVEFRFFPKGLLIGLCVSTAALLFLITLFALVGKDARRLRRARGETQSTS